MNPDREQAVQARKSLRRHMLASVALFTVLVGGVGGWSATTNIAGAVIAGGSLVVDTNVKKVQHQAGGVVRELFVREGDQVEADQVLIRLDDTQLRANLGIINNSLAELFARQARLEAERDDADRLDPSQLQKLKTAELRRLIDGEQKLFELRRTARLGKKSQLGERVGQIRDEIQGLTEQIASKKQELGFIQNELQGVRELWRKNLTPIYRVTALERDATRIEGERGALIASVAQAKGKITETELQILQIDQDLRGEVAQELREIQGKIAELQERRVAAEDLLQKIEIRAPQQGRVHQLAVHTIGGVIAPGEAIMLIVPERDVLIAEAHIPPQSIDQVNQGQTAILRFSAFNQRTTPELVGEVRLVSADVTTEPKNGTAFYTVRITVPEEEIAKLGSLKLVPGMPVEAFIQTGEHTVVSYLAKPLNDQIMRMFREH
jgi:HlyD family secretion protein